ncbi:DUF2125 domain-containing protein [Roseovarius sp. EL26]|uniref:DUF2125 domain-containing protein n=1 Tax=Roseovarius sp. EL26 TaxID=2126672 RepID=UPI000EA1E2CC|nr:DUF2125 domain-containing protein [Roseovarius sp. EL26]
MAAFKSTATSAVALSIFMTGSAAFADVTAEQVWADWKEYMAGFGYEVEATENQSGNQLVVSDLTMKVDIPDEEADVSITMGQLTFSENGDGTVSIALPTEFPIVGAMESQGENIGFNLNYINQDFVMTVSGDADQMTYDYSAALAKISLLDVVVNGEPVEIGQVEVSVADTKGQSVMTIGELRETQQTMTSGTVDYVIDMKDPESDDQFKMLGSFGGMNFEGTSSIPAEMDATDVAAMLAAGFAFDGKFGYGGGTVDFAINGDGSTLEGNSAFGGGDFDIVMDEKALGYNVSLTDMDLSLKSGDLPFPVEFSMQEYAAKLLMPVGKSDEEQDFGLGVTLADFTMSDMIWGMFDPSGQLPRDPATVSFDVTGKAKMAIDLMDPEAMEAVESGDVSFGELNAMNLNNLTVSLAGAELTGDGAFSFNNDDLESFGGMPAPVGAVDLKLVGGNGLLDKLVAMGFVPEDQAMGARMMMGLFAVPGEGDDTLTSKIEVTEDGQVSANGQRLK